MIEIITIKKNKYNNLRFLSTTSNTNSSGFNTNNKRIITRYINIVFLIFININKIIFMVIIFIIIYNYIYYEGF